MALTMRHEGISIKNIALKLGVSQSTVSTWVRGLELSDTAKSTIAESQARGREAARMAKIAQTTRNLSRAQSEAEAMVSTLTTDGNMALVMCALLYWCEGAKSPHDSELAFTNSDPLLIGTFLSLLRRAVSIDESRFRAVLHLHEYHNEEVQLRFWSNVTKIPLGQFTKTYWKPHRGKRIKPDYPGCITVKYRDVQVSRTICATARAALQRVVGEE